MIAPIDLTSDTDSDDDDVVVIMQPPNDDDEVVIEPPNSIADAVAVVELPMVVPVLKRSIHGRCVGNPIPMVQRRLSPSGFYYNPIAAAKAAVVNQLRMDRIAENDHSGYLTGPLVVNLTFFFHANHEYQCGQPYIQRPDVDNLVKFFLDAMTGAGFFADDCLVVSLTARKVYSPSWGFNNHGSTLYSVRQR